jgi:predicted transcriptional regulator
MIPHTVQDVFSKGFASVGEDDALSVCFSHFRKEMPPVLVVLDNEGKYKGVIARRWIIRSRLDPSATKVKTLTRSAPAVTSQDSLSKAAKLMIESEIRQLPVYSGENLLGFVTDEDVIHGAVMGKWGNLKIERIMTKEPFVVEDDESVGGVLNLFREEGISHAPVVRNGKLVGMVSIHDVIEHVFKPRRRLKTGNRVGEKAPLLGVPVKGIMTRRVVMVLPDNRLRLAAKRMHEFDISSLVVARRRRPVGIITKRDFLEPVAQLEKEERRLTLQFSIRDLGIDEIQRGLMIEDFDSFARRYSKVVGVGTLFVYMKSHGTNFKGDQLIHCRLQLRTSKGSFFASGEGWGVEQTFRSALDRLERQIQKDKEVTYDREFAREYLRRIRFPLTEL